MTCRGTSVRTSRVRRDTQMRERQTEECNKTESDRLEIMIIIESRFFPLARTRSSSIVRTLLLACVVKGKFVLLLSNPSIRCNDANQ